MNPIAKRILGLVLLGGGIAIAFWLKSVYQNATSIPDKVILFAPMLILYGGVMTVTPDLVLDRGEWATAPAGKKAINVALVILAVAVGLWVRFTIFKDWK